MLIFKRPLAHAITLDQKPIDQPRPQLLRMREVAQQLGLSRTTVYQMVNAGVLAYVKLGRAIRIPTAALDEWVASQKRVYGCYGEK
ncbi:MAG TPA: helix-turn-helix domain-containing protein [Fimbriimonadaceae bacterium]|nr:helix-turn-helix domain-containing protein [Fimbriimonadaceae bacterium]